MFITLRDNAILDPYFNECLLVILIFCGLLSVFLGSVGALYQVNIKNLLALSAVANMGYLLVSLSIVEIGGSISSILFFFIYILTSTSLFSVLIHLRNFTKNNIKNVVEFSTVAH